MVRAEASHHSPVPSTITVPWDRIRGTPTMCSPDQRSSSPSQARGPPASSSLQPISDSMSPSMAIPPPPTSVDDESMSTHSGQEPPGNDHAPGTASKCVVVSTRPPMETSQIWQPRTDRWSFGSPRTRSSELRCEPHRKSGCEPRRFWTLLFGSELQNFLVKQNFPEYNSDLVTHTTEKRKIFSKLTGKSHC
jgi:hypothetical protein